MQLNEASALSAADRALTSAAAASQPKAGFQVALGTIDPPLAATPLANAELMKSVGLFGRTGEAAIPERTLSTGGRQLDHINVRNNAEKEAMIFYQQIRASSSNADVIQISKNTGMPQFQVERVKQHLFINNHQLSQGTGRFAPDIEIADAWTRLQRGNFVKQDFQLLQHEYFEARFEGIFKTNYMTAHNAANNSLRVWNPNEFVTTPQMTWRP
jgi:hypothetical protein